MKTDEFLGATPNLLELVEALSPVLAWSFQATSSPAADEPIQQISLCTDEERGAGSLASLALCADEGGADDTTLGFSPLADETGVPNPVIVEVIEPSVCADEGGSRPAPTPFSFPNAASLCADEGPSDVRLKTDIAQVGTTVYGLPLYHFRYASGTERFEGVMAQDVLGVMPEAVVTGEDGFYRVNYRKLGIAMSRV